MNYKSALKIVFISFGIYSLLQFVTFSSHLVYSFQNISLQNSGIMDKNPLFSFMTYAPVLFLFIGFILINRSNYFSSILNSNEKDQKSNIDSFSLIKIIVICISLSFFIYSIGNLLSALPRIYISKSIIGDFDVRKPIFWYEIAPNIIYLLISLSIGYKVKAISKKLLCFIDD